MKKLLLGAAVSAALMGGAAQAAITLDGAGKVVVTPADTYEIYLSGASAALDYIEQLTTNVAIVDAEQMCDATQPIYKFKDQVTGKEQNAYYCTLNPLNPQLVGLAGGKTNLLIYKRSAGGSAQGVNPIIDEAKGNAANATIEFLNVDPSVCTVPTAPSPVLRTSTCTYNIAVTGQFKNKIPDFGISDVDPEQFRGFNTPDGFSAVIPSDIGLLNIESAAGQVFGIGATLKLRNALQEVQFPATSTCNPTNAGYTTGLAGTAESAACQPSLTRDQVSSIFVGELDTWKDLKVGAGNLFDLTSAANKAANQRVHACTRVNGSGTKAQFTVNFLNYPCATSATAPKADTGTQPEILAASQIHAMSTSGGVSECLRELNNGVDTVGTAFSNTYTAGGARWAVGIHGTEKNASQSEEWRFVKIDGVAPTLANVTKGAYHDWAELTFQYSKTHVFDTSEKAIVDEFIKAAGNPIVLATLNATNVHSFGAAGYLASPKNFAPDVNGVLDLARPVNPYSHATASEGVNNCRVPTVYNLGNPVNAGVQLF